MTLTAMLLPAELACVPYGGVRHGLSSQPPLGDTEHAAQCSPN